MFARLKGILKELLQKKAVILMYHQVCERASDPWQLAVSPENFDQQLNFLKNHFDVVPLEEIALSVRRGNLSGRKAAITFDDGFGDNYLNARPILDKHNLPATFYIATHSLGKQEGYWWDELEQIILHSETLPKNLQIKLGDDLVVFGFRSDKTLNAALKKQIKNWSAETEPVNERLELFMILWSKMKPLAFEQQRYALAELRSWSGSENNHPSIGRVMTYKELTTMVGNPNFTIGAHTVHHPMLAAHAEEVQAFEVNESKRVIEQILSRQVTAFAYPYGNYNSITKNVLKQAGFHHAVSTERRVVTIRDDIFELPRIQVKNWSVPEFSDNLTKLFSHAANR